jgi:hypothetical protein
MQTITEGLQPTGLLRSFWRSFLRNLLRSFLLGCGPRGFLRPSQRRQQDETENEKIFHSSSPALFSLYRKFILACPESLKKFAEKKRLQVRQRLSSLAGEFELTRQT